MTEPFDHQKWSFMLVAIVICWLLLLASVILGTCSWMASESAPSETVAHACEFHGKFTEMLQTILSSALAFAAGRVSGK
jgi:hypothetical protein